MYVKLGTVGVNYPIAQYNDFMIFSEVPDSTLSYESPVLVRTLEELDIWFGKSISDYQQLVEIIRNKGVLYLYKPISNNIRESSGADISEYPEVWYDSENRIPLSSFSTVEIDGQVQYRYIGKDETEHIIESGKKYNFDGEWYILVDGGLVKESDMPQNNDSLSDSLNNRDTLLLSARPISYIVLNNDEKLYWDGTSVLRVGDVVFQEGANGFVRCKASTFSYKTGTIVVANSGKVTAIRNITILENEIVSINKIYNTNPKYDHDTRGIAQFDRTDPLSNILVNIDSDGNTFAIRITYPKNTNPRDVLLGNGFFIYITSTGKARALVSGNIGDTNLSAISGVDGGQITIVSITTLQALLDALTDRGLGQYDTLQVSGDEMSGSLIVHVKDGKGRFTFNNLASFSNQEVSIVVDEETNSKFLYNYVESSGWSSLFFWSKTIGRDSDIYNDNRDIRIKLENLEDGKIKIDVSRYDYSETFVGSFSTSFGKESLDHVISKKSKLIHLLVDQAIRDGQTTIYSGEYILSGASIEYPTKENYWASLKEMFNSDNDPVCPDFVLIPRLSQWFDIDRDDNKFREYAEDFNTQFLVSESYEDEAYGNLLTDTENRILYFYGTLTVYGVYFPAYYPFIIGSLKNSSVYISKNMENTIGFGDGKIYPYRDTQDSLELDKYKCNYLVSNNQRYYYRKYNSGANPKTTGWRRFIIGKVYRELEKNKWEYLGARYTSIIKNKIDTILQRISLNFSMVRKIEITEYSPNLRENSIKLTIDVTTTDLVDNNITLDILINYNNTL